MAPDSSKLFPVSVRNRYRDWSSPVDEAEQKTFLVDWRLKCQKVIVWEIFEGLELIFDDFLWKVMNQVGV